MALIEVKVPDIGDFKDVAIIEVLVKVGDTIKAEQSLLTVESDKASMEIPSSHAGVVKELKVALGDKVNEGSVVVMLEVAGAAAAAGCPLCAGRRLGFHQPPDRREADGAARPDDDRREQAGGRRQSRGRGRDQVATGRLYLPYDLRQLHDQRDDHSRPRRS